VVRAQAIADTGGDDADDFATADDDDKLVGLDFEAEEHPIDYHADQVAQENTGLHQLASAASQQMVSKTPRTTRVANSEVSHTNPDDEVFSQKKSGKSDTNPDDEAFSQKKSIQNDAVIEIVSTGKKPRYPPTLDTRCHEDQGRCNRSNKKFRYCEHIMGRGGDPFLFYLQDCNCDSTKYYLQNKRQLVGRRCYDCKEVIAEKVNLRRNETVHWCTHAKLEGDITNHFICSFIVCPPCHEKRVQQNCGNDESDDINPRSRRERKNVMYSI
jgi:hypothetical protein